jgi:hypothetical protein
MMNMINILENPINILSLIFIFFIWFFYQEEKTEKFKKDFLHFGPIKDNNGDYKVFMGIKLATWYNIAQVYIIIFISSLLLELYNNIYNKHLHKKKIKFKNTIFKFKYINPIIQQIFIIIKFFATASFQLQFILPMFLGNYLGSILYL